jgi:cytochrome c oxidase assembly factor CtaG
MNADALGILQSWSAPLGLDLALGLTALVYARGWLRLRSAFPGLISLARLAAFFSGIAFVWVAIGSPLNAFDDVSLTVHMAQHLLLMAIAPPLILLGAPALPLLHGLPGWLARGVVGPCLRWGPVKRLGRFVTRAAIAWLVAALALIVWHIPVVFELALRLQWLHEVEHGCFFGAGLVFWWPVVQPWPSRLRWPRWTMIPYLLFADIQNTALSAFLIFSERVLYPTYAAVPRLWGISVLDDQAAAGAIMWVPGSVIFLVPVAVLSIRLLDASRTRSATGKKVNYEAVKVE